MRMVVLVLAGWTGSTVVAAGLFVAFVRGSGGTDLPPAVEPGLSITVPGQRVPGAVPQHGGVGAPR